MSGWNLFALIDHTVLRPDATKVEVLQLCQEAKAKRFTVIFVPPCYIDEAVAAVAGTSIRVGIPIGFALGRTLWEAVAGSLPAAYRTPHQWLLVAAAVPAALVSAALVAAWPIHRTARHEPASVLRAE